MDSPPFIMNRGQEVSPPEAEGRPPTVTGSAEDRIAQNLTKDNRTDESCAVDNSGRIQYTKDTKGAAGRRLTPCMVSEVTARLGPGGYFFLYA